MRVHSQCNVFDIGAHFQCKNCLGNQFTGVGANYAGTNNSVAVFVKQ
jgi:hypothetical protein